MDWETWPLFGLQFIAIALLILPRYKKILGLLPKTWVFILLWLVLVGMVILLYHYSTNPLHLYF